MDRPSSGCCARECIGLLSAAAAVFITAVLLSVPALAAEQRCNELGANCVCSEPLNTSTYVLTAGDGKYNPGDSTTKECEIDRFFIPELYGSAIYSPMPITGSNDALLLGRLPTRQSVLQYVLRSSDNYVGPIDIHHRQAELPSRAALDVSLPGNFTMGHRTEHVAVARAAARVYVYHSDDYDFVGMNGGACRNSKLGWGDWVNITRGTGPHSAYDFSWTLNCSGFGLPANCGRFKLDGIGGTNVVSDTCCVAGPRPSVQAMNAIDMRGKWYRVEIVMSNRLGPGYRLQMYLKNITDNTPETLEVDTDGTYGYGSLINWVPSPQLTPFEISPTGVYTLSIGFGLYRDGSCNGFTAMSHYLMAQWDANANQRIGAAYEVEGGSAQPPNLPPAAPTALRVQ